jgi:hypothetical protein
VLFAASFHLLRLIAWQTAMALAKSFCQSFARLASPSSGVSTDFLPGPAPEEGDFGLMQNKGD